MLLSHASAGSDCLVTQQISPEQDHNVPMAMRDLQKCSHRSATQAHIVQAVMAGPLLMAGLTDDTRKITANASDLASHVSEVSTEGLVSLRLKGTSDIYLQQMGTQVVAGPLQQGNAAAMAATFRMLDITTRLGSY